MKKTFFATIFAMAISCLAVLTSCTDDSPSGVVKTYFSAMKSGNAEKAAKCMNIPADRLESKIERLEKQIKRDDANMYLIKNGDIEILHETIDGDRAFVEISVKADGMGIQREVSLEKVDGQWKMEK